MEIYNTDSFDFLDKKTRKILLESREAFIPHTPYLYEKKMLEAVRMGDVHSGCRAAAFNGTHRKSWNSFQKSPAAGTDFNDFLYHSDYQSCHGRRRTGKSGLCYERQLYSDLRILYLRGTNS